MMRFESNAKGKSEIELRAQSVEEVKKKLVSKRVEVKLFSFQYGSMSVIEII